MAKSKIERKGWHWAPVPLDVITSAKLSPEAVRVYAMLLSRSNKDGAAWPGVESIAKDTHVSERLVMRALKELIADNWICRQRRMSGSSITYVFELQDDCRKFAKARSSVKPKSTGQLSQNQHNRHVENRHEELDSDELEQVTAQKTRGNPELYALANTLAEVCHINFAANRGRMMREAKSLSVALPTPTPELIKANYNGDPRAFWKAKDWRGQRGQLPTPAAIRETWGQWINDNQKTASASGRAQWR